MHTAGIVCDVLLDQGKGDGTFDGALSIVTEQGKSGDCSGIEYLTFWYNDRLV